MKRIGAGVGILLLVCSLGFCAEVKIGYVDVEKVFNSYKKTEDLNNKLRTDQRKTQEKIQKMMKEIEDLQKEMKILSPESKKKKEKVLSKKRGELRTFAKHSHTELLKERERMMSEILQDIDKVIQEEAKRGNYDIILDKRVLLYGNESLDITNKIIKALEK